MQHAAPRPGEVQERGRLGGPVGPLALVAPLVRHQRFAQAGERLGRVAQREPGALAQLQGLRARAARLRDRGPGGGGDGRGGGAGFLDDGREEGAVAVAGVVEVPEEGVVDDADAGAAGVREAEGDADVRVAVHEVRRAVDRVADEGRGRREGRAGRVGFFAEESGGWGGEWLGTRGGGGEGGRATGAR